MPNYYLEQTYNPTIPSLVPTILTFNHFETRTAPSERRLNQ